MRYVRLVEYSTIGYYEKNAEAYAAETLESTMKDAQTRFSSLLPKSARVLDWGCGSGRDAKVFGDMGYSVVATDASAAMCNIAKTHTGAEVRCEGFLDLIEIDEYDGIWACASLLHLRKRQLLEALARANRALTTSGVIYASFKNGDFEGYRDGRWYTDLRRDDLSWLLDDHWTLQDVWESADVRVERSDERWLNFLARKAC